MTRPMGASFGDLLSQPVADDGLGCATVVTRFMFLGAIAALILYITFSRDGIEVAVATVRSGDEVW